jgi:hypothetical protein
VRSVAKHEVGNICRYDSTTFCLASIIPVLLVIRGGHAHFFLCRQLQLPQHEGRTSANAYPQLFLETAHSTFPQPDFFQQTAATF